MSRPQLDTCPDNLRCGCTIECGLPIVTLLAPLALHRRVVIQAANKKMPPAYVGQEAVVISVGSNGWVQVHLKKMNQKCEVQQRYLQHADPGRLAGANTPGSPHAWQQPLSPLGNNAAKGWSSGCCVFCFHKKRCHCACMMDAWRLVRSSNDF